MLPTCRDCGGPIMWGHAKNGAPVKIEAEGMSDGERTAEPAFDKSIHARHQCPPGLREVLREHLGGRVTAEVGGARVAGQLLAVGPDCFTLAIGDGITLIPFGVGPVHVWSQPWTTPQNTTAESNDI
jgi:hypothetical protein